MVSTFVVLAIVLLALPVAASIFVCIANMNKSKRAKFMANAATTRTTMTLGPNGRTVFEATASRPGSPPRPQCPPHSPLLPYNIQQAYKAPSARKPSLKNAWQRLSRPFSVGPQQYHDNQIELTQKQPPMPYNSSTQPQIKGSYGEPVSPTTIPITPLNGSSSSWNTVDHLDQISPVSPLSVINTIATTSVTGAILHRYQSQRQQPDPITYIATPQKTFDTIPLTPPTRKQSQPIDLGSARGFIPPHVDITSKTQLKAFAKQKGKELTKQAVAAGAQHATDKIKASIVDANKAKVSNLQLAKPPKAKTRNGNVPAGFI